MQDIQLANNMMSHRTKKSGKPQSKKMQTEINNERLR